MNKSPVARAVAAMPICSEGSRAGVSANPAWRGGLHVSGDTTQAGQISQGSGSCRLPQRLQVIVYIVQHRSSCAHRLSPSTYRAFRPEHGNMIGGKAGRISPCNSDRLHKAGFQCMAGSINRFNDITDWSLNSAHQGAECVVQHQGD